MEKEKETIRQDMEKVEKPVLPDKPNCLDLRIPAHLVGEAEEEEED